MRLLTRNKCPFSKCQGLATIILLGMLLLSLGSLMEVPGSAVTARTTPLIPAAVANTSLTQTYPNIAISDEDNRGELLESLSSSFGLNASSMTPADGAPFLEVNDFRPPSSQSDFDTYLGGYTLYDLKSTEAEIWLYYTSSGSLTNWVVVLSHSNIVASNASTSCLENTTRDVASLLGVPIPNDPVISTISLPYANRTAVMMSEEVDGFTLAGCNIFVCVYDREGALTIVQCRTFFSIPSIMDISPQSALYIGREESPKLFLNSSQDVVLSDGIVGVRLCPIDSYLYSGAGNNTTVNGETQFRLGYEYVANVNGTSQGVAVSYKVLVAVDVNTGEVLVDGRSPIPVPANGSTQFVLFWQIGLTLFLASLSLLFVLGLVSLPPEVAFGMVSAFALIAMQLRGAEILDNFTRGRIYGRIDSRPGISFSELKEDLKLVNGNLAYHLLVLEKLQLIDSTKEGRARRYCVKGKRSSIRWGAFLGKTEELILRALVGKGMRTNKEIAVDTGVSKQRCSYNLRLLRAKGLIENSGSGWTAIMNNELETMTTPERGSGSIQANPIRPTL